MKRRPLSRSKSLSRGKKLVVEPIDKEPVGKEAEIKR